MRYKYAHGLLLFAMSNLCMSQMIRSLLLLDYAPHPHLTLPSPSFYLFISMPGNSSHFLSLYSSLLLHLFFWTMHPISISLCLRPLCPSQCPVRVHSFSSFYSSLFFIFSLTFSLTTLTTPSPTALTPFILPLYCPSTLQLPNFFNTPYSHYIHP